jgi:hypothetical protein
MAGQTLQSNFHAGGGSSESPNGFKWIKAELLWPAFDHLTFSFRNRIFAVLVDLSDGVWSSLSTQETDRLVRAAEEHDLIPCVFRVHPDSMRPLASGWNLVSCIDGSPVDPVAMAIGGPRLMSEWELHGFAVQVVRAHVETARRGRVTSICDVLHIDPQIWFTEPTGRTSWIVVRFVRSPAEDIASGYQGFAARNVRLDPFDGYFAWVSAVSSAAVLRDLSGNMIPPSRRFDGSAPLYRGDGFHVRFDGLSCIHRARSDSI